MMTDSPAMPADVAARDWPSDLDTAYVMLRAQAEKIEALKAEVEKVTGELGDVLRELDETWTDERGVVWTRPTAWAYALACKAHEAAEVEVARLTKERDEQCLALGREITALRQEAEAAESKLTAPIPMVLFCPACGEQHIDKDDPCPDEGCPHYGTQHSHPDSWLNPPHRSHLCHGCGHIWRPADVATVGVVKTETSGKADSPFVTPITRAAQAAVVEAARDLHEFMWRTMTPPDEPSGLSVIADEVAAPSLRTRLVRVKDALDALAGKEGQNGMGK